MSQSYIPLYRKYRPQTFADLVGQEVVVKALSNAIKLDKISHAYLFCGSRGTGKTSAARILAKSLNCNKGPTSSPCGNCPSCIDITAGSAIDVTEIDAASNNSVEDARNILEKVQFVPVSGKYKIFIIDEVHMLSNSAFNTLLKTLEEPPENLVFILATTEPHKILNTILSRCQRFDFIKIKLNDIIKRLQYIAKKENININQDAIEIIAQKSTGGLRDAVALLDQASVLGLADSEISVEDILSISGAISQDNLYTLTEALAKKQPEKLIEILDRLAVQGNDPMLIIKEIVAYFRNLLLVKAGGNSEYLSNLLNVSEEFIPKLKEQADLFEVLEIAQIIEKISEQEMMLRTTTNQMMWLEVILINILHRNDIKVLKDLEARVSSLEEKLTSENINIIKTKTDITKELTQPKEPMPVISKQTKPEKNEDNTEEQNIKGTAQNKTDSNSTKPEINQTQKTESNFTDDIKQEWINLLNKIESFPAKNFFIGLAKPIEVSSECITVALKNESLVKGAKESKKVTSLTEAANKFYGVTPKVNLITFDDMKDLKKNEIKKDIEKQEIVIAKNVEASAEKKNEEKVQQIEHSLSNKAEEIEELKNISPETDIPKTIDITPIENRFSDDTSMVLELFQGKIIE